MSRLGDKGPNLALRHERERRGWSQADLAEKIGVEVVSISRWERGTNAPTSAYTIKKLCDLFGKTRVELGFFSKTHDEHSSSLPTQEPPFEPRNPYKGLRAFRSEDVRDFFGRDQLIDELAEKLEKILAQVAQGREVARLLAVIGPSGSGKSSVVMAGLVPRLQLGELPESEHWVYLKPMTPGAHSLEALAVTLWECLPERTFKNIYEDLRDGTARTLHLLASSIGKQPETKVVLVVDQFEELFTQTTDEQEREHFIDLLLTASTERDGSVLVILTLRADFYDRPMSQVTLGSIIETQSKSVFPMNERELLASIGQPAGLPEVQLTFEEKLVGDLLFDIRGQVGALPLLQFTLDQLFQRRSGHTLTRQAYHDIGGVKGALAKHAEETYAALPSEQHQTLARVLFLRLIDLGTTEQDTTRRRAALSELTLLDSEQTIRLQETTNTFVVACLLTTSIIAGSPTVEVSHEALLREWPRLADWVMTSRSEILIQQTIREDVAEWVQRGQPPSDRLYRGSQLAEAQAWATHNLPSVEEMSFIEASREDQEREETEESARQTRELALQRQATRRQSYVIGLMAVTSLILIVALAFTLFQQARLRLSLPASVFSNLDSGPGSLREAIANAQPNSTITFEKDLQGPIRLTHEIDIAQSLIISGPGVKVLSISGQGKHRVFRVLNGAVVTILNLTITDGFAANCPRGCDTRGISSTLIISDNDEHAGGAILNGLHATLTLINVTVSLSTAGYGAIFNNGMLTLLGSHISTNKTSGLFNSNQGTLTLEDSIVSGNIGATYGGGINSWGGGVSILTSTISDNTAIYGGGLYTAGNLIVATLVNSTISDNTAITSGGGICSPKYGPTLVYTTVYRNKAGAIGGGIAENAGEGCGNYASDPYQNYVVDLKGSIIAGDSALKDPDIAGNVSLDYPNLIQHRSSGTHVVPCDQNTLQCILGKKSLFNLPPLLGPLQDNGGPTPTHALLVDSPALNQIPVNPSDPDGICANPYNLTYPVLNSDQRGESRPYGKGCDLGAYEAQQL